MDLLAEDLGVGDKGDHGPGFIGGNLADLLNLKEGFSPLVLLDPELAVALDLNLHMFGEGVHDRRTDAVETTGNFVSSFAELSPGVKFGHHDLERGELIFGHDIDRNSPAVVRDRDVAVFADVYVNAVAGADEGFVDGVVDDL